MALAVEVEERARQYVLSFRPDGPVLFDETEIARMTEKFKTCGVQPDADASGAFMSQRHDSPEDRVKVLDAADWLSDQKLWKGRFEGVDIGAGVTVLAYSTDRIGEGPVLHRHPYDEIFLMREGRALFTVGDRKIEVAAGQVVLGPANLPHKYHNLGPGPLESIDIHVSDRWIQTDIDDPELDQSGD